MDTSDAPTSFCPPQPARPCCTPGAEPRVDPRAAAGVGPARPSRCRHAEVDLEAAGALLCAHLLPGARGLADLPDELAASLSAPDAPGVGDWAAAHRVSRATAWRWFHALYAVAPARYRVEARARRAWWRVVESDEPLATIAAAAGFADQAHMTRDIRALTGRTPGEWRRVGLQHSFKTAAG
ncbi:helix-turn-helix domain-containing protein [Nannocystis exedens]|uniref:helix-turn-helix domain-containing protein n=1 Tax=Nannocystis exedens TaxID=54 RepID=UPI000A5CF6EB|nr:helix-turn-helix domain-containing protein [Nannocystis exedens]